MHRSPLQLTDIYCTMMTHLSTISASVCVRQETVVDCCEPHLSRPMMRAEAVRCSMRCMQTKFKATCSVIVLTSPSTTRCCFDPMPACVAPFSPGLAACEAELRPQGPSQGNPLPPSPGWLCRAQLDQSHRLQGAHQCCHPSLQSTECRKSFSSAQGFTLVPRACSTHLRCTVLRVLCICDLVFFCLPFNDRTRAFICWSASMNEHLNGESTARLRKRKNETT